MPKISHSHIKAWRILLPSLEEQERIVGLINTNCSPIDSAISRLTHEIHLLLEYRTRLVSDVVTGKLDVREAAAKLPDETVPGDAVEDIDEIAEDGVASDEEIAVCPPLSRPTRKFITSFRRLTGPRQTVCDGRLPFPMRDHGILKTGTIQNS